MSTPEHKGLLPALLAVQSAAPTLPKDKTNPHFKSRFTGLDTIVEHVGPILSEHSLVWMTLPGRDEHGDPALHYRLAHAPTGEVLEGTMPLLLSKADAQGMGSAITYARRYSLCAVLNLVADDDDDGNAAGQQRATGGQQMSSEPSEAQLKELARQKRVHNPPAHVLAAMLLKVGAKNITEEDIATGAWASKVTRTQVSGLLDIFKGGVLPTGKSDIPSDIEPPPTAGAGDDVPFELQEPMPA